MKICDLTQFYSPRSGGVKRYLQEKIAFVETHAPECEHVLIVPGQHSGVTRAGRSTVYTISSPLVPRSGGYRALLDLRAIDEAIAREHPDILECADPYQLAWKSLRAARNFRIPAIAFYHSHFPEAYLRGAFAGRRLAGLLQRGARAYVRNLYNRFEATIVPSAPLRAVLQSWGVSNLRTVNLGVDTEIFRPIPGNERQNDKRSVLPTDRVVLIYVGRLAAEKNTTKLFRAFELLSQEEPAKFHLVVIGDGPERAELLRLQEATAQVTAIPYCSDPRDLAQWYRAADLFVHPGVQETFGLVALESQACGTPVVGIRGTYLDEIIFHDQKGWADENSAEALAAAVLRMSACDITVLGQAASAIARERYSWHHVFERLLCIYRDVCANFSGKT